MCYPICVLKSNNDFSLHLVQKSNYLSWPTSTCLPMYPLSSPIAVFLSYFIPVTMALFLFIASFNSRLSYWLFSGPGRQIFTYLASSHRLGLIQGHLLKNAFLDYPTTLPWCSLQHSLPGYSLFVYSNRASWDCLPGQSSLMLCLRV